MKSYKKLTSNDLIAMGMKPELVGRAPAIVGLNNLTVEDYKRIILESKISYVNIIKELLALNGVKLNVTEGFINELAKRVAVSKIGARSIREIIIGLIGELEYEIHLGDIKEITLDESLFYQNVFSKTV